MSYAANFGVKPEAVYAGFGARLAAAVVDGAIVWEAAGAALWAIDALCAQGPLSAHDLEGLGWVLRPATALLYYAAFEGGTGATPGKMMMLLRVQAADGRAADLRLALARNLAKSLSALTLGIGFVLPMWTTRHRALHDLVAGSVVVREPG